MAHHCSESTAENARGAHVPPGWSGRSRARLAPETIDFQFFHSFPLRRGCQGRRPWLGWCVPRGFQPPRAGLCQRRPSLSKLIVPISFSLDTGGNRNPHGERAFSPERAWDSSPGQASRASAALGKRASQISPSPLRILRVFRNPLPARGRGVGEWGLNKLSRTRPGHPLCPAHRLLGQDQHWGRGVPKAG